MLDAFKDIIAMTLVYMRKLGGGELGSLIISNICKVTLFRFLWIINKQELKA